MDGLIVPNIPKHYQVIFPPSLVDEAIREAAARTRANGGDGHWNTSKLSKRSETELDREGVGGEISTAIATRGTRIIRAGRICAAKGEDMSDIWIGGKRFDVKTSSIDKASLRVTRRRDKYPSDGFCLVTADFSTDSIGRLTITPGQVYTIRGFIMFDEIKRIGRVREEKSQRGEIIEHWTIYQSELMTLHEALKIGEAMPVKNDAPRSLSKEPAFQQQQLPLI
jgi:hypothetical protein